MSHPSTESLISAWLEGRLNEEESEMLQQRLRESGEARKLFREFTELDASLREIASGETNLESLPFNGLQTESKIVLSKKTNRVHRLSVGWTHLAIAAMLMILVGGIAYQLGKVNDSEGKVATDVSAKNDPVNEIANESDGETERETTLAGHATLRRGVGIQWASDSKKYRDGDVLPGGKIAFDAGVAEIDFFCGATVVVEGPACLELESDWTVGLLKGRLRANVPPAARGFVVKADESEIVDLGTEFALHVDSDSVRVKVVDGEVKLRGGQHDGQHLTTGQSQTLRGDNDLAGDFDGLSTVGDVQRQHTTEQLKRFEKWKTYSQEFRQDPRLIAYYPIADSLNGRFVPNVAASGSASDGKLVGSIEQESGRFGGESTSIGFGRPGSRVRSRIDGEFKAFTFSCWVKINSLENRFNALFLGDGYENGEPHWQIRNDGRMMMSVMINDQPGSGLGPTPDSRLNWVYFTEPIWDVSKSGQWIHLAAVYDPPSRQVTQFVDGELVKSEKIRDRYYIERLRIGPGEIGNWGQPFRKSPDFAVRNLNGSIDELAIFGAALTPEEIKTQYENGKPFNN